VKKIDLDIDEIVRLYVEEGWTASALGLKYGVGVEARRRRIAVAGTPRPGAAPYASDLWRVNVNEGLSLRRLVATIEPFSRHAQRRATMAVASENVSNRLRAREPA
jgi:hypothetical protein